VARPQQKHLPYLIALATSLAALLLYLPTLSLPLIYDDLLHIRIAGELNLLSVWLPTASFGFYRPLTFLPLLLIERVFGGYPPALLHGLNVLTHALNAALLSLLVWRLWHKSGRALAAGLLLALFPFSYQAIAVYGHNVHPTTTGIMLLALHSYLSARRAGARIWWTATAMLFVLGLLSHESVILFGPLAFLTEWVADGRFPLRAGKPLRDYLRAPWFIFSLLGAIYLVGYQFLPLSRAPQADVGGGAWPAKALYLFQALAYGFVWPARFLPAEAGAWLIMTSALLVLVLLAVSARTPANRPGLALGLGWWGLAGLLLALPLSANYLLHGPRLLYLSSVGLALLWPMLLEPLGRLARPLPALLLFVILLQNWLFVREKLQVYEALTGPVAKAAQVMADRPADEGVLLVNLPQWISPAQNTYPAGVEIAAMLGEYLFAEELIGFNLGRAIPVQAVRLPELLSQPERYRYGVHEQSELDAATLTLAPAGVHVFLVSYGEDGPETRYAGLLTLGIADSAPMATFGAYNLLDARAEACDDEIIINLTWGPAGDVAHTPTTSVFAQALNVDGMVLAQADGPPLGLRPDLLPPAGDWVYHDHRVMPLEGDQNPAALLVGVYDFATGVRFPAAGPDGEGLPDNALRLPIEDCPPDADP